jgi:membrane protease YdiL (CAAX protease family)
VSSDDVEIVDAPDADEVRWGLGDVFGGWVLVFVASGFIGAVILAGGNYSFGTPVTGEQIGAVAGQVVRGETPTLPEPTPLWLRMVLQAPLWAGLLAVPYVVSRLKGRGWVQDFGLRMSRSDIGVGLVAGVVAQLVLIQGFYWLVFRIVGERDVSAEARELTDRVVDPFGLLLLVLIVGVGAPVAEEVFFRGFAQRAFEKRGMAWQWAVFCTALFFAASHLQPLQFPGLLIFGAIAGWLVHRAGRIGPAVWAHLGFNLTAVVMLTVTL